MESIKVPLRGFKYFTVYGGPYRKRPSNMRGVKMAVEINEPCDVSIPTRDYSVPHVADLSVGLTNAVDLLLQGEPLYIGCMGGVGRTGLFLAVLAKAFGVKNPVEYVRDHYSEHAVETPEQYKYVSAFAIPLEVENMIKAAKRRSWFSAPWKLKLTAVPVLKEEPATVHGRR